MFGFLGSGLKQKNSKASLRRNTSTRESSDGAPLPSPSVTSTRSTTSHPDYISDESQLQPPLPVPEHLADLNKSLEVLASVFPHVQVEVFREMLASISAESRLAIVTDMLLRQPDQHIKGRRIVPGSERTNGANTKLAKTNTGTTDGRESAQGRSAAVPRKEAFREDAYKQAVYHLAAHEFKSLSRSSIQAVLLEHNYSYLDARATLAAVSSKSWRVAISTFFSMRKPATSKEATQHPLVIWRSTGTGSIFPMIKSTGHPELDRELFDELIAPLQRQERGNREASDREMAVTLHTEEAEACEAMYECACCFTESTFEEFTTCNTDESHMVCFQCVQHSMNEALFGQGWQRNINKEKGALQCPAVSSTECQGHITSDDIFRAVSQQKNGAEIMHKLDQRLADHGLVASGIELVHCPFCSYAEADDIYIPDGKGKLQLRPSTKQLFYIVLVALMWKIPISVIMYGALLVVGSCILFAQPRQFLESHFHGAYNRLQRKRRGLKFNCQNSACARESCISCSKAWVDIHVCHESSLVALRTQVEQAMAMAVKRVCPKCNTSFVKNGGCNKLTCPCGYKMCYVCRKDIGKSTEGYRHFCEHFRAQGDGRPCAECNKCNLWEQEDTNAILRQAKTEAEAKWLATEQRELSDAERAYLHDSVQGGDGGGIRLSMRAAMSMYVLPKFRRIGSVEGVVDVLFELLFA